MCWLVMAILKEIEMIPTELSEQDHVLVKEARDFAQMQVAPVIEQWEAQREVPVGLLREGIGLFGGLLVPRSLGGREANVRVTASVLAELARADLAFAFSLVVHLNLTGAIARIGSKEQKEKYLDRMMRGDLVGSFCLTEPEAGTDAASLRTRARQKSDGNWELNGTKAWTTNAVVADLYCVYAQVGEATGSRAIGSFLVERSDAGVEVEPAYQMMGGHVMGTSGLSLNGCLLPKNRAFAPAGEGFAAAMQGIDLARVVLSGMCCAILEESLAEATRYAASRQAFSKSTLNFQGVQFPLADVQTSLRASQLLTDQAINLLDQGGDARVEAAHAKKMSTRSAFKGIAASMQAMGARGFRRDCALPRHLACAKMAEYLDGTTEVQNIVIGRSLSKST
ncbi:acyl-CoA dehydrogenase family protein [Roseovarius pacificus]|uniref:acyl-CoA dehydrogenase family protein n=1 Tax=Roseovarius pacificus TaxID=337701 RepID=UPI0040391D5D